MTLSIRPALPEDAVDCAAILSHWIDDTAWMPRVHTPDDERAFLRDLIKRGWVTVAVQDRQLAGFLASDGPEIHALYLAKDKRAKGIGTRMLGRVKQTQDALFLWTFQANLPAQKFYLRQGFREVDRTDGNGNDEGLPDIRYEWSKPDEQS